MNYIFKTLKAKYTGLLFVTVVASILRLIGLGSVPYGFANDEVSYIISGYSIAVTNGFDLAGKFLPISINLDSSLSPVPVYLIALFAKLFTLTPEIARLPFALLGIGSVIGTYLLVDELFHKRSISFLSSLILAVSSWHILVTRGVWDVIPAQFFYILGIYLFVKAISRNKNLLWSLIPFLFAFYSYHGTKVFFVGLIALLLLVYRQKLLKVKKQTLLFLIGVGIIIISFILVLNAQSVTRQKELLINNDAFLRDAKKSVDFNRERSLAPNIFKDTASNKIVFTIDKIVSTYLGAFSTENLLFVGDINPVNGYGTFFKGVIYLMDFPFLLLGFAILVVNLIYRKNEKYNSSYLLILGLVAVSPLPSAIGAGTTYVIRSFMLAPFLSIVIGFGIVKSYNFFERPSFRIALFISIFAIYLLLVIRFLYQYYYQFNFFGGEYWNVSNRLVSEKIISNIDKYDKIVVGQATDRLFLQYSFFSRSDPKQVSREWQHWWPMSMGKILFSDNCQTKEDLGKISGRVLYIGYESCEIIDDSRQQIVDQMEPLRVIWNIYDIKNN